MIAPAAPQRQPAACPSCGRVDPGSGAFCVGCGQSLTPASATTAVDSSSTQSTGTQAAGRDWRKLGMEALAGARRFWPFLGMIALAGMFDFRLNGQMWFPVIFGLIGAGAIVFQKRLRGRTQGLNQVIPTRFIGPVMAGVPAALLYFTRWKGTQSDSTALLTGLLIAGFGIGVTMYRSRINEALTPLYEVRNRYLPKAVRMGLMFVVPIFLTFLIAHGNLGDISALFGGSTSSPESPAGGGGGMRIILTTVLSMGLVFVLLNEPQQRREAVVA